MHGRVKVRTTAEQEELKKIERAKKVVQYRAGINLIFKKRKEGIYDVEILSVTEQMVLKNPDIYTLWNVRREAFDGVKWETEEDCVEQLKKELTLTEHCLRVNPKSYSVWHQRCWVNDRLPQPDWQTELSLCSKCLNLDERNFHCWDYRQYVVKKAGISEEEEFKFSTSKIESNFSNYSSWHYRSLLLPKIFPDDSGNLPIEEEKHTEELDLVMNATFTDPNDTSAWFYQRWLLNARKTSYQTLWRVKMTTERVLVSFNKEVSLSKDKALMKVDDNLMLTEFKSYGDKKFEFLWISKLSNVDDKPKRKSKVEFIYDDKIFPLEWSVEEEAWIYKSDLPRDRKRNIKQLSIQLENYKQLAQIEPDNKWALLTGIVLMKYIDPIKFHDTILEDLSSLVRVDKLRERYYNDLRSKYIIDFILESYIAEDKNEPIKSRVDLSCMNLTTLYNEHYFSFTEEIHLGGNKLYNSLIKLKTFQSCVKLSLSSNEIKSLKRFPVIESLRYLSLRNNKLSNLDEILELVKSNNLTELDIRDNPISKSVEVLEKLSQLSPKLKIFSDV